MDQKFYGVIEMTVSFGLVLGILVWQLVSVRRSMRKDSDEAKKK